MMKRRTVTQKNAGRAFDRNVELLTQNKLRRFGTGQNGRMQWISHLVGLLFRGMAKIALLLVVTTFLVGILCIALLTVLFMVIRFVLTGRKPTFVTAFTRFHQTAQQYQQGQWPQQSAKSPRDTSDVVDVESREARSALAVPPAAPDTH